METTLDELKRRYQARHDRLDLGGVATPHDDGAGRVAFYDCEGSRWHWYAWEAGKGYVLTGSTLMLD